MTATEPLLPPTVRRRSAGNLALWGLQLLLAAGFIFGGVNKLFGLQQEMLDGFAKIGLGDWFRHLTGMLELAGGLGLLVHRLAGPAALGLAGVMLGAVVAHLTVLPPPALAVVPAVLAAVFLLIARRRWPRAAR